MCVTSYVIILAGCCLLYFISWMVYYVGIVNVVVILGLAILPCLAFSFFAIILCWEECDFGKEGTGRRFRKNT